MNVGTLYGQKVFLTEIGTCENKPVKEYIKKKWMSKAHHARIQKKWVKRYGTKKVYNVISGMGALFIHPEQWQIVKEQMEKENARTDSGFREQTFREPRSPGLLFTAGSFGLGSYLRESITDNQDQRAQWLSTFWDCTISTSKAHSLIKLSGV